MKRLEISYGMRDNILARLKSYLAEITQCNSDAYRTSLNIGFEFGVPQSSVLGPENHRICAPKFIFKMSLVQLLSTHFVIYVFNENVIFLGFVLYLILIN